VQSILPDLRGWNRCNSQPGIPSRPRMQSLLWHDAPDVCVDDFHFQRRDQRLYEVELADGATYLQNAAPRKTPSMTKARRSNPARARLSPRAVPQAERFVSPQEDHSSATPATCFAATQATAGPSGASAGESPRTRNGQACKRIAGRQQAQDQEAPPVDPGKNFGEVHRSDLRSGAARPKSGCQPAP